MNENYRSIPATTVGIFVLWGAVLGTLVAAWVVMLSGGEHVAVMLGFTSTVLMGVAGVFTIRCYHSRTRGLVRALFNIDVDTAHRQGELHRIT